MQRCTCSLSTHRSQRGLRLFCSTTRSAKQSFFDNRIAEIASTNKCSWDLMSWVKQHKLPAVEAIQYQGLLCNSLSDLWHALHSSYNAAVNRSVQLSILDDVLCLTPWPWVSFSMLEMSETLKACSNVSAPGPDHITWRYLKSILADRSLLSL